MDQQHPHGQAKNILEFNEGKPVIVQGTLDSILDHEDVKNRKVVAFSIIGAYRKGKSFFLGYCLRFLYANYKSINFPENPLDNSSNWMGDENEALKGFSWRSGRLRDTTGIIVWNDVFLHTVPSTGEEIAIIVMDTQGLFDNQTSPEGNARIFSLGILISSMQLLNLMQIIQEDQLQYLQFATEFARFVADDNKVQGGKPFQNLMFLIRDWSFADEYAYGKAGGEGYLEEFLAISLNQKPELKNVRKYIKNCFEEISCSLLPPPGHRVAGSSRKNALPYNGNWKEMDVEFKDELKSLIEKLLNPDNLVLKKINGERLKGAQFKAYVEGYLKLFLSEDLPPALTIYESTVENQLNLIVTECLNAYKETVFKNVNLITTESQIPILNGMSKNKVLLLYKEKKKMGNAEHDKKFNEMLEVQINKAYQEWSNRSASGIQKINEEREKTRLAIEEKERLALKQMESEKKAAERLLELERMKNNELIEQEKYKHERQIAELRLEAERYKTAKIEADKLAEEAFRKQLESSLELERAKGRINESSGKPWYNRCITS